MIIIKWNDSLFVCITDLLLVLNHISFTIFSWDFIWWSRHVTHLFVFWNLKKAYCSGAFWPVLFFPLKQWNIVNLHLILITNFSLLYLITSTWYFFFCLGQVSLKDKLVLNVNKIIVPSRTVCSNLGMCSIKNYAWFNDPLGCTSILFILWNSLSNTIMISFILKLGAIFFIDNFVYIY